MEIEYFYSPFLEMVSSLHVVGNPDHHMNRREWMKKLEEVLPASLITNIRRFNTVTGEWLIPMEFIMKDRFRLYDIPLCLDKLSHLPINNWKSVFRKNNSDINQEEKTELITLLWEYYNQFFQREALFLHPFLTRLLEKEKIAAEEQNFIQSIPKFHNRIHLEDDKIIFNKNKDYTVSIEEIKEIRVTVSSFISPHLLFYFQEGILKLTKLIAVERKNTEIPGDLLRIMKALADETRLRLIRHLCKSPDTTQHMAELLNITEAGTSKQLKILHDAGIVEKKRTGNYIFYSVKLEVIDFISYRLYELFV